MWDLRLSQRRLRRLLSYETCCSVVLWIWPSTINYCRGKQFIHQWLYSPFLAPGLFLSFLIISTQTVGLLGRVISQSQRRYLHTGKQTQNKRTQTFMPWVGEVKNAWSCISTSPHVFMASSLIKHSIVVHLHIPSLKIMQVFFLFGGVGLNPH
jgi:hypothetical protein